MWSFKLQTWRKSTVKNFNVSQTRGTGAMSYECIYFCLIVYGLLGPKHGWGLFLLQRLQHTSASLQNTHIVSTTIVHLTVANHVKIWFITSSNSNCIRTAEWFIFVCCHEGMNLCATNNKHIREWYAFMITQQNSNKHTSNTVQWMTLARNCYLHARYARAS